MSETEFNGRVAIRVVSGLCLLAFGINIYPGMLDSIITPLFLITFCSTPFAAAFGLILVTRYGVHNCQNFCAKCISIPKKSRQVALFIILISAPLLILYIPRRIAFAASRSAFQQYADANHQAEPGTTTLHARFGVYRVDRFSIDPRGGMYFRTHHGIDGMGPDEMSYGFCYQPNSEGTPFGNSGYHTSRLGNGWSWFSVSDDS